MGTSNSVAQFVGKIEQAGKELAKAKKQAVRDAAVLTKKRVESARDKAVGSDGRMSRVGKNGAKLSVNYRISGDSATVTARGPWPLIESDMPRHTIRPRKGGKAIRMPNGGIRRSVVHPGTKGKHPFRKGIDDAIDPVTKELAKVHTNAIRGVFT